ncbi:MAG: methylmalonyl-CoA mutase family protein [Planctomycetota bacterium]|nr:methylmalonyl-CoA mutase family protein [Planctomycetota bacterium]
MQNFKQLRDDWEARLQKEQPDVLKERKESFKTLSDIPVQRAYFPPDDLSPEKYMADQGLPGEYPFIRGVYPSMYRGRLWTMRQYAGFATAEETNKRYRYLLDEGQTGLSVAFDLPTQMGYDSDHPMSEGEVGKVGVAISTLDDMRTLFDAIPLAKVSTSMTINSTAAILLGMYVTLAGEQGAPVKSLAGTIQNDVLKEYIARGTYILPPGPSLKLTIDLFEFCTKNMPRWNMISISGYHMREAGCTAAQEIGFTLSDGICYVEEAIKRGLDVNRFGAQLSFFFCSHNNLLEEVAKFRAARRLWARIMVERFKATDPRAMMLRFHTQTAGCSLTAQQPNNNVVRVAYQALAAVLGGTQSLHTNSRDEALSLPTEESVRIALRTQQVLAFESGVVDTADPLAGSYYVESLTDELESRARDYIGKVDALGGTVRAIEAGYIQSEIERSAYEYQKRIESEDYVVVGVNKFQERQAAEGEALKVLRVDPSVRERQVERIRAFRSKRNGAAVNAALQTLRSAAKSNTNLVQPIVDAVKALATLGEISDVLREVYGEYRRQSRR